MSRLSCAAPSLPLVVAVGGTASAGALSSNGKAWSNAANSSAIDGVGCCGSNSVAYSAVLGRFVAVADNGINSLAYSDDGNVWIGLGVGVFSTKGWFVIRVEELGIFVAVGQSGSAGLVASSADGKNFSVISSTPVAMVVISYFGGRFIASDDGSGIYYSVLGSPTGWTNSGYGSGLRSVCWINASHVFGSCSSGVGAFSTNGGLTWLAIPLAVGSGVQVGACIFDGAVAYVGGQPSPRQMVQSSNFFGSWQAGSNVFFTSGPNSFLFAKSLGLYLTGGEQTTPHIRWATNMSGPWTDMSGNAIAGWVYALTEASNSVASSVTIVAPTTVDAALSVSGDITVNSTFIMGNQSQVVVSGNAVINSEIVFVQGALLNVSTLVLSSGSLLQLVLVGNASSILATSSILVTVATFAFPARGAFGTVATRAAGVSASCLVSQPDYGSSTLTVTVSLSQSCSGVSNAGSTATSSLSGGAIAGIAVGSIVAGVCIAVVIVLVIKYLRARSDAKGRADIAAKHRSQANVLDY